ncbi:MAG: MFS transporter [Treponema sp.]|nr:MFS transporter [Treponema sp.]
MSALTGSNVSWKRPFFTVWAGQALSLLSSAVLQMGLIWHLALVSNSALVLSMASMAAFLPMALLMSFAGALVDRWNRKLTMIGADLFIALISLVLGLYTFYADPPLYLVMGVLFLRSLGTAFHSPAISAITPLLVPPSELTRCAGYTHTIQTLGFIAGTSLAAILYPLWGLRGMIFLDVLGAVLASLAVALVKIPPVPAGNSSIEQKPQKGNFLKALGAEVVQGYGVLKEARGIFAVVWLGVIFSVFYSPVNALFPLLVFDYFGGTTTQASIVEILFALGMVGGGLVLGVWGGFKNRGLSLILSVALIGLPIGISGLLPPGGFMVFAALSFLMGFSAPFYSGPLKALVQERIGPEYLGRVFGLYGSLSSAAMFIGLIITGLLADMTGFTIWFVISGSIISLLALVMAAVPSIRGIEGYERKP